MPNLSLRPPSKVVKKLTTLMAPGSILDIGAGKGRHAIYLTQKGFDVTALEPAEDHARILSQKVKKHNLSMKVVKKDLLSYSPMQSFDAVAAISVLHFLKNKKEVDGAVTRMQAWTKPSGLNVVSVMMNIDVNNPKPYLFMHSELKNYYEDWDILFYEELLSDFYEPAKGDKLIRSWVARLIARKSR